MLCSALSLGESERVRESESQRVRESESQRVRESESQRVREPESQTESQESGVREPGFRQREVTVRNFTPHRELLAPGTGKFLHSAV